MARLDDLDWGMRVRVHADDQICDWDGTVVFFGDGDWVGVKADDEEHPDAFHAFELEILQ